MLGLLVAVELGQEVLGKQLDVAAALAQRRQLDGEDAQAIEQVLAELAFVDRGLSGSRLVAAITRTSTGDLALTADPA